MATAKPQGNTALRQPRRRWSAKLALAGLAVVLAGLALGWTQLSTRAVAAAAYAARVGCSCRYIGGRDLGDCRKDAVEGIGPVQLGEDASAHAITARYLPFPAQTARLREGAGCVLDPWRRR